MYSAQMYYVLLCLSLRAIAAAIAARFTISLRRKQLYSIAAASLILLALAITWLRS
jgi:hypothetical protein